MNKKLPLMLLVALLSGCQAHYTHYDNEEYISTIETSNLSDFNICVFNDVHLSILSDIDYETSYYDKVLKAKTGSYPDLLIINGDLFMDGNKEVVNRFFNYLDTTGVKYCFNYGNHDLQGQYSNQYINNNLKKRSSSLLKNPKNDDVYGDSNYVVNIKVGGTVKWQLYVIDSNTYDGVNYDVVHDDQIAWYVRQIQGANGLSSSDTLIDNSVDIIPSLVFMHIPFEEFYEAWEEHNFKKSGNENNSIWYMGEYVSCGGKDNNFYETMHQMKSTKGVIVAHDHINLTDWSYDKIGTGDSSFPIRLIYGMKTGQGIYHDKRIMGANFYTLKEDKTFSVTRMVVPYEGESYVLTDEMLVNLAGE